MARLTHKVAIITGGNSGIGKAVALKFAEEGARVVIAARREGLCQEVADHIRQMGGEALGHKTDVTSEAQVEQLIAITIQTYGRLDILVNNAGIFQRGHLEHTRLEEFDRVLQTNLRGTFLCCRAGFQKMKEQGEGGTIINMSSVTGVDAWAGVSAYSASKHGMMGLTKALADEGRAHHIKVCAICPGGVANELVDATPEDIVQSQKISPFDVAETAVFLASLGPYAIVHRVIIDRLGAEW